MADPKDNELNITIAGRTATGKTTFAELITRICRKHDIANEADDIDLKQANAALVVESSRRLIALGKRGLKVNVHTVQVQRPFGNTPVLTLTGASARLLDQALRALRHELIEEYLEIERQVRVLDAVVVDLDYFNHEVDQIDDLIRDIDTLVRSNGLADGNGTAVEGGAI